MARYAEWNKFIGNLKTDKYGATNVNEVGIAFEKATADVVPKSEVEREYGNALQTAFNDGRLEGGKEVAREIFEEIEKALEKNKFQGLSCLLNEFAELKKKYAESENG